MFVNHRDVRMARTKIRGGLNFVYNLYFPCRSVKNLSRPLWISQVGILTELALALLSFAELLCSVPAYFIRQYCGINNDVINCRIV